MADFYIRELEGKVAHSEGKVAHYEAIMSRCAQCKTKLPIPEAEYLTPASRHSRSSGLVQQPAAEAPPPALIGPSKRSVPAAKLPAPVLSGFSKRSAPASTLSSSARSSKQLHPASRIHTETSDLQQPTPSNPPSASSNPSHQTIEAPVATLRHPRRKSSDHPISRSEKSSAADPSEQPTTSSQTLSTHPSSLSLSIADGRHHHSGELVDIDLQKQYKKPRSRNQGGMLPGESIRHAQWMRTADIMLKEVPFGRHWRDKMIKMDSSIIAAVAMRAAPVPKGDVSPTEDTERKELLRLVRRFAERQSERRINFEQLILVCLCKVLSSQGVPQGKIVETLQICISDTSERNIDNYLKGATWANKMMSEMFLTDWGYRAIDLIAICIFLASSVGPFAKLLNC